jgi:octaprenyl-diphosphate synthase
MIGSGTQDGLFALVSAELHEVEGRLHSPEDANGHLLGAVARHALASGGKRIRPALLLLAARACGGGERERAITLASVAEMMHAATLIHDDIVDHAGMRRGRPSAKALWGADVSVLVGDFLYSRAIQILVADGDMGVLRAFADATVCMTEGEILQLERLRDLDISEADYFRILTGKTAALMSATCRVGALVANATPPWVEALAAFGLDLGIGFQLVDDALDYTARQERLGKPVASDFREGKITYPLIHVMRQASPEDRAWLEALSRRDPMKDGDVAEVRRLVERYEAVPATMRLVDEALGRARAHLRVLPGSAAREALERLVEFVRDRDW